MYRQHAHEALRRGLQHYFDLLEPIMPPSRSHYYIEEGPDVHVMSPQQATNRLALITIDPDARTAIVLIETPDIYHFFPGDEDFHEETSHVPIQHNRNQPSEYTLHVDLSDLDWLDPYPDGIFLRKQRNPDKRRNAPRPPGIPARGTHHRNHW